jgi:hypothetical protein
VPILEFYGTLIQVELTKLRLEKKSKEIELISLAKKPKGRKKTRHKLGS